MKTVRGFGEAAAGELSKAVSVAWPGGNARMIHEKNLTAAFAFQLHQAGFTSFFEPALIRSKIDGPQPLHALDLLALHPGKGVVLVGESKSLYGTKYMEPLVSDAVRMSRFLKNYKHEKYDPCDFKINQRIAVSLAMTNDERYADWWSSGVLPKSQNPIKTAAYHRFLSEASAVRDRWTLITSNDSATGKAWYVLAAMWEVST